MAHTDQPIFINGRFLTQPVTGVQRYARTLLDTLDGMQSRGEISKDLFRLVCLTPPDCEVQPDWKAIDVRRTGRLTGNLWEQLDLPLAARRGLLFSPCNTGPLLHFNQVVVIHDASVFAIPDAYTRSFRLKYHILIRWFLKTARRVITDSDFSRRELIRWCRAHPERIEVVPAGSDHILAVEPDPETLQRYRPHGGPYFLAVGSQSRHKNLGLLSEAVRRLKPVDYEVIVAGGTFQRVFQGQQLSIPPGMRQIGYVTDRELRSLYANAIGFIFPSLYEGFGFPPLEAMACGCPVIISTAASLPEVGGEAAFYCDPNDPGSLCEQMEKLRLLPREELSTQARRQAAKFPWRNTALRLSGIFQSLQPVDG